jgi:hypothetical protein
MPIKPRTRITLLRIAAIIFALNVVITLFSAYEAHQEGKNTRGYIARAVIWAFPCIAFIRIAQKRRRAMQADEEASSKNSDDGIAS